jgi:DNA-binding GntR family transcriptional regulator
LAGKAGDRELPALPASRRGRLAYRTLATAALEEIRHRILNGDLAGGTKLGQDALAAEFGISRIPIREALLQLEAEGLVRIEPHKGAVVAEVRVEDIEELCALRAMLEPRLLLSSAPLLTPVDYARLTAICTEYSHEMRAHNIRRWGELNTELHALLYQHADQPRTLAIVRQLLQATDRITRLQLLLTDGLSRAEREHARIVRLCQKGAYAEAAELLQRHIQNVGNSLALYLRRQQRERGEDEKPARCAG